MIPIEESVWWTKQRAETLAKRAVAVDTEIDTSKFDVTRYPDFESIPTAFHIRLFDKLACQASDKVYRKEPDTMTAQEWHALRVMNPRQAEEAHRQQREKLKQQEKAADELRKVLVPDEASARIKALAEHAVQLCIEHRIRTTLNTRQGVAGYADSDRRVIAVRPIISDSSYATALHEIGHVVHPKRESGFTKAIEDHNYSAHPMWELAAWRWACRHAKPWTRKMHDDLQGCVTREAGTYRAQTDNDGDCDPFALCIRESAFRISDRALTFEELEARCQKALGLKPTHAAHGDETELYAAQILKQALE